MITMNTKKRKRVKPKLAYTTTSINNRYLHAGEIGFLIHIIEDGDMTMKWFVCSGIKEADAEVDRLKKQDKKYNRDRKYILSNRIEIKKQK